MTAKDALGVHGREELGISEATEARPITAALTSALTFAVGAAMPLVTAWLAPHESTSIMVAIASLIFLAVLGAVGAAAGGAGIWLGTFRVTFWGVIAMAVTYAIGSYFGTAVA